MLTYAIHSTIYEKHNTHKNKTLTRSIETVHTSAKVHLTRVAIMNWIATKI